MVVNYKSKTLNKDLFEFTIILDGIVYIKYYYFISYLSYS